MNRNEIEDIVCTSNMSMEEKQDIYDYIDNIETPLRSAKLINKDLGLTIIDLNAELDKSKKANTDYVLTISSMLKENESLRCCGNCGHPERSGDYCPYALTNVFKHHYCSNWIMYESLKTRDNT